MTRLLPILLTAGLILSACELPRDRPVDPDDPPPVQPPPAHVELPQEPADRFALLFDDDEHHLFAISRPFDGEMLVMVVNWSDEAHGLRIPKPAPGHYELAQRTTDEPYRVQNDETGIIVEVGAQTVLVLREAPVPEDF